MDFLIDKHPEYLDLLRMLKKRGQIRFLAGGYFEPILALIPPEDRIGQINKMKKALADQFGEKTTGIWLAERIWEDSIIPELAATGILYTLLDEEHFEVAGIENPAGYYVTDYFGKPLNLFPISRKMRYATPWQKVPQVIEEIRKTAAVNPLQIIADDGEKFGAWPGCFELVYKNGWLDDFFSQLVKHKIETVFLEDQINENPPTGRVYLQPSGYDSMNIWALSVADRWNYEFYQESLTDEKLKKILQKGYFKNFLVKYPESNLMHKKMLQMRGFADNETALELIYAAQCNCVYWHGLFGGIYLPVLREAVYERLIAAQAACRDLKYPILQVADLDQDGQNEVFCSDGEQNFYFTPTGGSLYEWDLIQEKNNLINTFSRKPEIYHREAYEKLSDRLCYDAYQRHCCLDHFLAPDTVKSQFDRAKYGEQGDFLAGAYKILEAQPGGIRLERTGIVITEEGCHSLSVRKDYRMSKNGLELTVALRNLSGALIQTWYGLELNLSFPEYELGETIESEITQIRLDGPRISLEISSSEAMDCWGEPVFTVTKNFQDFELIRQGYALLLHKKIELDDKIREFRFTLRRSK